MPSFLISAGAVLFFDATIIYSFYRSGSGDINIRCTDVRSLGSDIHLELRHIPVEFAGAITSVVFYVSVK